MVFGFPAHKRVRVIVNTDAKDQADDQYAIVHVCAYETIETRFIHEDFFAKLAQWARDGAVRKIQKGGE